MLNRFRKTKKEQVAEALTGEQPDVVQEEVTFEKVEDTQPVKITYMEETTPVSASMDDMSDDEILAKASEIQARAAVIEEKRHQQAIDDERMVFYKRAAEQQDRVTRGRREQTYNEAMIFMPRMEVAFGDTLSLPMKKALCVITYIYGLGKQEHPNNSRMMLGIEDFFVEDARRASAQSNG